MVVAETKELFLNGYGVLRESFSGMILLVSILVSIFVNRSGDVHITIMATLQ